MRYNRTSLAYKVDEYSEVDNLVSEAKKVNTKKNKKTSPFFVMMCVFYIVAIVSTLLVKTATINEKKAELTAIKNEYSAVVNKNKKMEVDINSQIDLRNVEDIAIAKLSMNQPRKNQVVYISTEPKDYGEVKAENGNAKRGSNIFASLIKTLNGYYEYSN